MSSYYRSNFECRRCGQKFLATRSDAKYCSPSCRKQASLQRKKVRSICETTIANVKLLLQYSKQPDFSWDTKGALAEISKLVGFTDTRQAADQVSRDPELQISNVEAGAGTASGAAGKSVPAGIDTSHQVQPDVKSLKDEIDILFSRFASLHSSLLELQDLPERLHYFNDYTKSLSERVNDIEEAIDWSKVS